LNSEDCRKRDSATIGTIGALQNDQFIIISITRKGKEKRQTVSELILEELFHVVWKQIKHREHFCFGEFSFFVRS